MKLALTPYDAKTGAPQQSLRPVYGFSERTQWVAPLVFDWQTNDLMPDPQNDEWVGEGSFEKSRHEFRFDP